MSLLSHKPSPEVKNKSYFSQLAELVGNEGKGSLQARGEARREKRLEQWTNTGIVTTSHVFRAHNNYLKHKDKFQAWKQSEGCARAT